MAPSDPCSADDELAGRPATGVRAVIIECVVFVLKQAWACVFESYPRVWVTTPVAAAIYANFFTHHFIPDLRWVLLALVAVLWWRTTMRFRVWRAVLRVPVLLVFLGVALFAEDRRVAAAHDHLRRAGDLGLSPEAAAGRDDPRLTKVLTCGTSSISADFDYFPTSHSIDSKTTLESDRGGGA